MNDVIDPRAPVNRSRAYTLRQKLKNLGPGEAMPPDEIRWLEDYDAAKATNKGASASSKVSYTEETHQAVGTGDAAEAAAMGQLAREEGRRLDYLVGKAMEGLATACKLHETMAAQLLAQNQQFAGQSIAMLDAIREHFIARTEAEAELIRKEAEDEGGKDEMSKMAESLLPILLERMQAKK